MKHTKYVFLLMLVIVIAGCQTQENVEDKDVMTDTTPKNEMNESMEARTPELIYREDPFTLPLKERGPNCNEEIRTQFDVEIENKEALKVFIDLATDQSISDPATNEKEEIINYFQTMNATNYDFPYNISNEQINTYLTTDSNKTIYELPVKYEYVCNGKVIVSEGGEVSFQACCGV